MITTKKKNSSFFVCMQKSQNHYLNQVHLGPVDRVDDVELDPVAGVC